MTTIPDLGVQRRGSVLWLTIRREERRNALSPAVLAGGLFPAQVAEQALALGLLNHVDADLDGRVEWLLQRLADKSPAAIRRGLCTLKSIDAMAFEEAMAFTESQVALFAQTEDAREGLAAFREKRAPQWTDR